MNTKTEAALHPNSHFFDPEAVRSVISDLESLTWLAEQAQKLLPWILVFWRNRPERRKPQELRVNAEAITAHASTGIPAVTARASNSIPAWL